MTANQDISDNLHIHHSIPKKYEATFQESGINIHEGPFLRAVDPDIHLKKIHGQEWSKFDRLHNGQPSTYDIYEFQSYIDNKYADDMFWGNWYDYD